MINRPSLINSGLYSATNISINDFIKRVDELIQNYNIQIINGPDLTEENYKNIFSSVNQQVEQLAAYGRLIHTTQGVIHLTATNELMTANQIREYYKRKAELIKKYKKCTCDGLGAVVFDLSDRLIKMMYAASGITVELCLFKNWSHTLLHVTQKTSQGYISLFYDPWYQRCYTLSPNIVKTFSPKELNLEMEQLINLTQQSQLAPIIPTEDIFDCHKKRSIVNHERDFSYYVTCSTSLYTNPAIKVSDPSNEEKSTVVKEKTEVIDFYQETFDPSKNNCIIL